MAAEIRLRQIATKRVRSLARHVRDEHEFELSSAHGSHQRSTKQVDRALIVGNHAEPG
jgi:hypothetical protein